jgi:hypothetical protein
MSAKKKRRKSIVVNNNQKQSHCGPECKEQETFKQLFLNKPFAQRLLTPLLVELETETVTAAVGHGAAEEVTFEVFTPGVCHQTYFEGLIFPGGGRGGRVVVIEGNREATQSRDALVELINFCEEELEICHFVIAIPRKRHDHREFVGRLTNFLDFSMMVPFGGWTDEFVYVSLDL